MYPKSIIITNKKYNISLMAVGFKRGQCPR